MFIARTVASAVQRASSGPSYDPDAIVYFTAVAANGGTITTANKTAFNNAFLSLKSTNANDGFSLWSHINQGYFFFGQESYSNGLFVPFYNTNSGSGLQPITTSPATPNGSAFTYTKTGGLVFDSSTNNIDTGINNSNTGAWPTTTNSVGPSNYRHGYVYITNTAAQTYIAPFGQASTLPRSFQVQYGYNSNNVSGRYFTDAATSVVLSNTYIPGGNTADGGWGINQPISAGGAYTNLVTGTNKAYNVISGTPQTASLVNSNILIGQANGAVYSGGNFLAATFGCGFNNSSSSDFTLLDNIIATLKAALV